MSAFINITQVTFAGAGAVESIKIGMGCPKLDTRILTKIRQHSLHGKKDGRPTGKYWVEYMKDGSVSLSYQVLGHYDLIQGQFYSWRKVEL